MRRKIFFAHILAAAMIFSALFCAACKGKETQISDSYVGIYKVQSFSYGGFSVDMGQSNPLLGFLTDNLAVLTLRADGTANFKSEIIVVNFDFEGTWESQEEGKITLIIPGQEGEELRLSADCDGTTVVMNYGGGKFTMKR